MRERSKLSYAMALLPDRLKAAVLSAGQGEREKITELRLRRGRSLSAVLYGREYFLTYDGRFMNSFEGAVEVTAEDISHVSRLCALFSARDGAGLHYLRGRQPRRLLRNCRQRQSG